MISGRVYALAHIKDEFGKFKWIDQEGRTYPGTPYPVEPDVTAKTIFVASMMHITMKAPALRDTPDVACPSDAQDSERRKEVVHHEEIPVSLSPRRRTTLTRSRASPSKPKAFQ